MRCESTSPLRNARVESRADVLREVLVDPVPAARKRRLVVQQALLQVLHPDHHWQKEA
jgi:hypothetical protein